MAFKIINTADVGIANLYQTAFDADLTNFGLNHDTFKREFLPELEDLAFRGITRAKLVNSITLGELRVLKSEGFEISLDTFDISWAKATDRIAGRLHWIADAANDFQADHIDQVAEEIRRNIEKHHYIYSGVNLDWAISANDAERMIRSSELGRLVKKVEYDKDDQNYDIHLVW